MPENVYFTIVGIDLFEENTNKNIRELLESLNISNFLEEDSMIIGNGIKKYFDKYHYFNSYDFKLINNEIKEIKIFKELPIDANIVANDLIIMDINLAKEILNIKENESTDIILNVPNNLERQNVSDQLIIKHSNIRIHQKENLKKEYENMFNYKGGIFLILFIIVIITFTLILYQRYSMISLGDKKEIGILKAVGWSIKDIIKLKIIENFIVGFMAYIFGVIFAYIFVFIFNAPLIKNIFIGSGNLENEFILNSYIQVDTLITLFLFFMIPFLSAILIPVWKIAIIDSTESMK
ncbi:MAG: ABC transporter permease [Aliarcobacter sp.]|nr:ABC transporter permease [Aliarcobacter sp.]